MVKSRKTFEFKRKTNTSENFFKNKIRVNSCRVTSLPNRFVLSKSKSLFFATKIDGSLPSNLTLNCGHSIFEKQDLQFFYSLCTAVFALETTFKKSKNSNLLTSFNFEKLIFLPENTKNSINKTNLNLLFFYNFSFLLQSYLNLFSATNISISANPKVFISLLLTAGSGICTQINHNEHRWTLRRAFRKLQIIQGLSGNLTLTHTNLLMFWSPHKKILPFYRNRKEHQYLYYLRRLLDKNDSLGKINLVNGNEVYADLLTLFIRHKSQKYRSMSLKNVLRKPLRRRVSRWALLPRLFIKERQQEQAAFQDLDENNKLFKAEDKQP